MKMKIGMPKLWSKCMILVLLISVPASLWNRSSIAETDDDSSSPSPLPPSAEPSIPFEFLTSLLLPRDSISQNSNGHHLQYDFYRSTCPDAEKIVRKSMAKIHSQHPEVSAALLRLMFHDCFSQAGGPFYPLFTGRRDSTASYYAEAMAEISRRDDNIRQILHLFHLRGFTERDTVSLLGAHSIGLGALVRIH